jgi:Tol biopolymer transport system component
MQIAAAVLAVLTVALAAGAARGSGAAPPQLGLYQIRLDGTGRTQLLTSNDADIVDITAVSPDRTRVLMLRLPSYDLYSASIDGSGLRLIASRQAVNGYLGAASWSPSGARIAFEVSSTDAEIWVAKSDGMSLRRLVKNGIEPSWSPDGRRIAYIGRTSDTIRLEQ